MYKEFTGKFIKNHLLLSVQLSTRLQFSLPLVSLEADTPIISCKDKDTVVSRLDPSMNEDLQVNAYPGRCSLEFVVQNSQIQIHNFLFRVNLTLMTHLFTSFPKSDLSFSIFMFLFFKLNPSKLYLIYVIKSIYIL